MNGIATYTLEDLVKSLQITRDKAQQALDRHEVGVLSRVFHVDEKGRPAFVVWECKLPTGDGGERHHELLRLPWESFYESEHVVAEISLDLDCEIGQNLPATGDKDACYTLRPGKQVLVNTCGKRLHKFQLTLEADKNNVAEAAIDGIPLEVFLDKTDSPLSGSQTSVYKSMWLKLKSLIGNWPIAVLVLATTTIILLLWLLYTGQF